MFGNPHSSPHPLTAILLNQIEARRVPASSRPAIRDVAKTYALQAVRPAPGAGPS